MSDTRTIAYLAPDTLRWEDTELGYQDWLEAMLTEALADFYAELRWEGWQDEIAALSLDRALLFYPFLFTAESHPRERCRREAVPLDELWRLWGELGAELADLPDTATIEVVPTPGED